MTSKAQMTKEKIDWTATKFKTFMLQMTPAAVKTQPTEWEETLTIHTADKGLVSRR